MNAGNFGQQIVELKEQNRKLIEENVALKKRIDKLTTEENAESKKRPIAETAEKDGSPPQMKQMKLSSESGSSDLNATKMDTIGEKITIKPKSVLNPNCLHDVLAWIKRTEMADSALSTSSRTFQQFCWPKLHGNVKPHIVSLLVFHENYDEFGKAKLFIDKSNKSNFPIPIASVPPPNYIVGFRQIQICFFNRQTMKFMESIYPFLKEFNLSFDFDSTRFYSLTSQSLGKIRYLSEMLVNKAVTLDVSCLNGFLRFQPNANAIIENLKLITTGLNSKNIDLLIKWVTKYRTADHGPKMLRLRNFNGKKLLNKFIDQIKKEFSVDTYAKNFIIKQWPLFNEEEMYEEEEEEYPEFVLENEQTNEMLSYYAGDYGSKFLMRFSKENEHLRKEWEKQMKEMAMSPKEWEKHMAKQMSPDEYEKQIAEQIISPPHKILVSIWEIGEF